MTYHEDIIRLLTQPEVPGGFYFHFCTVVHPKAGLQWLVKSQWCGYTKDKPRREIRKGRLFHGEAQRQQLHERGFPTLLINEAYDLTNFYSFGGHALILKEVAEQHLTRHVAPSVSLRESGGPGFVSADSLEPHQLQHAPTKKLRMHVLTRDGRRCLICGRSPAYYIDVELHVHHAVPWGQGGITEEENLVSICKTCHDGLDPHFDPGLIQLLREKYPGASPQYFDELKEYQSWLKENMTKAT